MKPFPVQVSATWTPASRYNAELPPGVTWHTPLARRWVRGEWRFHGRIVPAPRPGEVWLVRPLTRTDGVVVALAPVRRLHDAGVLDSAARDHVNRHIERLRAALGGLSELSDGQISAVIDCVALRSTDPARHQACAAEPTPGELRDASERARSARRLRWLAEVAPTVPEWVHRHWPAAWADAGLYPVEVLKSRAYTWHDEDRRSGVGDGQVLVVRRSDGEVVDLSW